MGTRQVEKCFLKCRNNISSKVKFRIKTLNVECFLEGVTSLLSAPVEGNIPFCGGHIEFCCSEKRYHVMPGVEGQMLTCCGYKYGSKFSSRFIF